MGKNKEIQQTVSNEAGEEFNVNISSLVSDIHHHLMNERRKATELKPYNKMTEAEQEDEIARTHQWANDLVLKAVETVALAGHTAAHVELVKFDFDIEKQAIKITASGKADDQMLIDMKHSKGKLAKITIIDDAKFIEKSEEIQADKDQPEMFAEPDEMPPVSDDGMSDEMDSLDDIQDDDDDEMQDGLSAQQCYDLLLGEFKPSAEFGPTDMTKSFPMSYAKATEIIDMLDEAGLIETSDKKGKYKLISNKDTEPPHDPETGEIADDDQSISDFAKETSDAAHAEMSADSDIDVQSLNDAEKEILKEGEAAAIAGAGKDECLYDGGTRPYMIWQHGLSTAYKQIEKVREAGENACAIDKPRDKCPWKAKSNEYIWWNEGYDREEAKKAS